MIEELENLGVGHYEAKALEALFKQRLDLRELSRIAGIPFGKVYSVVKNLKEKNIVKETNSRPKLVYVENVSEIVSRLIRDKQEKEESALEKLREIASQIDKEGEKQTRFFQIGTNNEENKKIQMRSFVESEIEVLQIINIHHKPNSNRESKLLWEKEIEKAVKRGVVFRAIYPKSTELPPILRKLNKESDRFQVKRLDTDFTRCDIIDKKKILIKLVQRDALLFGGIIFIENEKLADNLARIFEQMWQEAE